VERNTRTLGPAKEGNYSDSLSNQQVVSNAVPSKVRMAKLKEQVQSLERVSEGLFIEAFQTMLEPGQEPVMELSRGTIDLAS
jgi:hypothetical protein